MNDIEKVVSSINWGAPSIVLAILTTASLILFSRKAKRFTPMWIFSAVGAGAGFLLGGWVGLFTLSMAISYRFFQKLVKPWQAILTWTAGVSGFALLVWMVQSLDPKAVHEGTSGGVGNSILDGFTTVVDAIAQNRNMLMLGLFGGAIATYLVWRRMHGKKFNPYMGEGDKVPSEMMYNGLKNPDLQVIPPEQRDPTRVFSSKQRSEKLQEQKGVCAYQGVASNHPKWEAFRSGVQWEGDHIIPHAVGGATNSVNLQMLCADCNGAKSSKYGALAMEAIEKMWKKKG